MDQNSSPQHEEEEWNYELHRAFVECIFMEGLKACSPSVLMDQMHIKAEYITSERVKSHLQKFRRNNHRSVEEFMTVYDTSIDLCKEYCREHGGKLSLEELYKITNSNISTSKIGALTSGEVAAYLTMVDMACITTTSSNASESQTSLSRVVYNSERAAVGGGGDYDSFSKSDTTWQKTASGDPASFMSKYLSDEGEIMNESVAIELPTLTESEKNTALGAMLCYVMGLFLSLKQRILDERFSIKTQADQALKSASSLFNDAPHNGTTSTMPQSNVDGASSWKYPMNEYSSSSSEIKSCTTDPSHKQHQGRKGKVQGNITTPAAAGQLLLEDKLEAPNQDFKSLTPHHSSRVLSSQQRAYFYQSNPHELQTNNWATYAYHGLNMFRDATYFHDTTSNHRGDDEQQDRKLLHQWQVCQQQQQQHYFGKRGADPYYSYTMPLPTESTPKASSRSSRGGDPIFQHHHLQQHPETREGNINRDTMVQSRLSFDHHQTLSMERYSLNEQNHPALAHHEYSTDDLEPYQIPPRNRALSLSLHSLDFDVKDSDDSSTDSSTGGENKLQSPPRPTRTMDHQHNKRKSSEQHPADARSSNKYPRTNEVGNSITTGSTKIHHKSNY
mmetsp:Transcript_2268/g.4192  ORF Transcript_2268/g.4192 Transcript_2268/m.4192 type:complete len:616 (-) Transcript_2268:188-2035(-)